MKILNSLNFFRKPPNNTLWKIPTENSVGDYLCNWHDEQCSQFTNGITEGFYRWNFSSVIPLVKMTRHLFFCFVLNFFPTVIPSVYTKGIFPSVKSIKNLPSVGDSLYNWHDEQCSQFTNGITEGFYRWNFPSVIPLVKMTRHLFFLLCFKFFSHGNSVGKIPQKFTDENILLVFPFVFINFLVVI